MPNRNLERLSSLLYTSVLTRIVMQEGPTTVTESFSEYSSKVDRIFFQDGSNEYTLTSVLSHIIYNHGVLMYLYKKVYYVSK